MGDLDWAKIGKLGGDVGQIGIGVFKRDPRMIGKGSTSFAQDVQNGVFKEYDSWPGTDKPWEQGDIPAPSVTPPDDRSSLDGPSGGTATDASRNPNLSASPPAAPLDDAGFSGGLVGRLAALLGAGPQNPDLPASQPDDSSDAFDDDGTGRRTLARGVRFG